MTWSWLFGDFERDDSVEGVPRGGIVWLKERCYIQDDIWQRYEVSGDVLNHPVLIVDTPETDGQLKDNERRILTVGQGTHHFKNESLIASADYAEWARCRDVSAGSMEILFAAHCAYHTSQWCRDAASYTWSSSAQEWICFS